MNSIKSCILDIISEFDNGKGVYKDEVYIGDLVDDFLSPAESNNIIVI